MSRLNRHSLSPDPPLINPSSIKYKSGLILQQQERNSSYQSYKKLNHDYENFTDAAEYILHTGSLASRAKQNQQPLHNMKGLVSKRTAELEAKNKFLQGTLQNNPAGSPTLNQTTSTTLLNLSNTMRHKSPFQIVQPKNPSSNGLTSTPSLLRSSTSNGSLSTLPSKPPSPYAAHRPTLNLPEQPIYQNHQVSFQQQLQLKQHHLQQQQLLQQQQQQQQTQTPVKVLYNKASGYKSQIENKVKIMNETYMSNMHVRVPSQDSSIYSDTKTYIDVGQPVAIGRYCQMKMFSPGQN